MTGAAAVILIYHCTSPSEAQSILDDGFFDDEQSVSDLPVCLRPAPHAVIAIEWNGTWEDLHVYKWNVGQWPPHGNWYREWRVPGDRLNVCQMRMA